MNPRPEIIKISKRITADEFELLVRDVHAIAREQQTTDFGVPSLDEIRRRLLKGESVAEIVGLSIAENDLKRAEAMDATCLHM